MKELKRQICCFRDWFGFVFIHLFTFNCIWYYLIAYNLSKISCMLLSMQEIAHDRPCALWIGQTLMVWFRNFARKGTVERDCEMVGLHCALENHLVALAHIYQITHETIHHHTFFFESVSLLEDRNSSMWSFVLWTHGKWMQYDQLVDLSPKVVNPGPFSFLISEEWTGSCNWSASAPRYKLVTDRELHRCFGKLWLNPAVLFDIEQPRSTLHQVFIDGKATGVLTHAMQSCRLDKWIWYNMCYTICICRNHMIYIYDISYVWCVST